MVASKDVMSVNFLQSAVKAIKTVDQLFSGELMCALTPNEKKRVK